MLNNAKSQVAIQQLIHWYISITCSYKQQRRQNETFRFEKPLHMIFGRGSMRKKTTLLSLFSSLFTQALPVTLTLRSYDALRRTSALNFCHVLLRTLYVRSFHVTAANVTQTSQARISPSSIHLTSPLENSIY